MARHPFRWGICFLGLDLDAASVHLPVTADEIHRIIRERVEEFDIPVLAGLPVGHGRTNVVIPLGLTATLDTGLKTLIFHETATV